LAFSIAFFWFFYFSTIGVFIIFMPKVLDYFLYTPVEIGIIFAIHPLMRFLTPFIFLKKITLSKKIFITSLFFSSVFIFAFYFTIDNFYLFLINNIFFGVTFSLVLPYVEPIAVSYLKKERYGKIRIFGSIGFMLSALIIGKFLDIDYSVDLLLAFMLLCSIFAINIVRKECKIDLQDMNQNSKFSLRAYYPFWISLFLVQVSFGSFYNFFTIYETSQGISLEMVSYLWSIGVICEIIMFYYQLYVLKKFDYLAIIKVSILITIFRWLLVFLFPQNMILLSISQSLHAFSFALYHSTVVMYLFELYDNKKLSQQFFLGIAYGLGGFVGAILAGQFYGEYLFLFSAVVAFFAFVVLFIKTPIKGSKKLFY
jgi:PPP family 3-phenylpropionic acid transporter